MRQPIESGEAVVARANAHVRYPARFQLIAAMNPCPCGYLGNINGACRCTPDGIRRYQGRISWPLLDRIDIQIEVGPVPADVLSADAGGEQPDAVGSPPMAPLRPHD